MTSTPKSRVRALLREPLIQFIALGGLLFLAWSQVEDRVAPPQNRIVITAQQVSFLHDLDEAGAGDHAEMECPL